MCQFEGQFAERVSAVFRANRDFYDHRLDHPWLRGSLGDANPGVYFIAEDPSLSQVERARDPASGAVTPEAQWFRSRGNLLFRQALVHAGFKSSPANAIGGWNCYITNVIKEADYAKRRGSRSTAAMRAAAAAWSSVLEWEIDFGQPRLVVTMGD